MRKLWLTLPYIHTQNTSAVFYYDKSTKHSNLFRDDTSPSHPYIISFTTDVWDDGKLTTPRPHTKQAGVTGDNIQSTQWLACSRVIATQKLHWAWHIRWNGAEQLRASALLLPQVTLNKKALNIRA